MTALIVVGIILGFVLFIIFGYYLWSWGINNYGFNIFGTGVLIRGIISYIFLFLALISAKEPDNLIVYLSAAGIMWLWTFIVTLLRTNIFIAVFSLIYQFIMILIVKAIIEKILKIVNDWKLKSTL